MGVEVEPDNRLVLGETPASPAQDVLNPYSHAIAVNVKARKCPTNGVEWQRNKERVDAVDRFLDDLNVEGGVAGPGGADGDELEPPIVYGFDLGFEEDRTKALAQRVVNDTYPGSRVADHPDAQQHLEALMQAAEEHGVSLRDALTTPVDDVEPAVVKQRRRDLNGERGLFFEDYVRDYVQDAFGDEATVYAGVEIEGYGYVDVLACYSNPETRERGFEALPEVTVNQEALSADRFQTPSDTVHATHRIQPYQP